MNVPRSTLALAAAAATGIQVGAAIVGTRYVVHDIGPFSLALLRYAIGLACIAPFVLMHGRVHFMRRDLFAVLALGIGQFAILVVLLNLGLQFISSTRAALLFATLPLITMVVAALLGSEPLTGRKTVGVAMTIAGVAATMGENLLVDGGRYEWLGVVAVLGSALCGALCSVFYRPYLARYPTLPLAASAMLASVVFLAVAAGLEGIFTQPPSLSATAWTIIFFIGVSSGVAYMLWLWALKHASPTHVTVFLSLSPLTAALLGVSLLGESLTPGVVLGMLGVAGGLWVSTR
ncbi:DMT family transporter [Pollutimonas subterranea]|uniref:DMT family transporter n=1 Tax=Pollutimonas subterranea TaxID=2045210 RepID=UPI0018EC4A00|nr:DMT family transporter [Pollutimonas subterranea]